MKYSAMRKKEILFFVTTYMDLEDVMLSKIKSWTEKDKYCMISPMFGILRKPKLLETESRMVIARG